MDTLIEAVLGCLLNRGLSPENEAVWFAGKRHDDLIRILLDYLNAHRHFLGYCQIQSRHALNERGVDVLLAAGDFRAGFQIKSHGDVKRSSFSADVKRQFADALSYGLDHYYLLICSPLDVEKKDLRPRINSLLNDMELYQHVKFTALGPTSVVKIFRDSPPMSRDDLLTRGAIFDECLHEYEKGYEHLPEVYDDAVMAADASLNRFGEDWWDSKEGLEAYRAYNQLVQQKQAAQFNTFASALTPEIQQKRKRLISAICNLLAECRESEHWRSKDEDRLVNYLEDVPEEMIPYTSIPRLLQIHEKLEGLSLSLRNLPP